MAALLAFLTPLRWWLAAGIAVLAAAAFGAQHLEVEHLKRALAEEQAAHARDSAAASDAARRAEATYRATESALRAQFDKEIRDAQDKLKAAQADLARADAVARSMRRREANLVRQYRDAAAAPGASADLQAAARAIAVLSDLRQRADETAGELAAVADERAVAIQGLVSAYNHAREQLAALTR